MRHQLYKSQQQQQQQKATHTTGFNIGQDAVYGRAPDAVLAAAYAIARHQDSSTQQRTEDYTYGDAEEFQYEPQNLLSTHGSKLSATAIIPQTGHCIAGYEQEDQRLSLNNDIAQAGTPLPSPWPSGDSAATNAYVHYESALRLTNKCSPLLQRWAYDTFDITFAERLEKSFWECDRLEKLQEMDRARER